jgi:phage tail sheath protein FI
MPVQPAYPSVYIEEIPSGVRTVTGAATSIPAFFGYTSRGAVNKAEHIFSFADFDRGLHFATSLFASPRGRLPAADCLLRDVSIVGEVERRPLSGPALLRCSGQFSDGLPGGFR